MPYGGVAYVYQMPDGSVEKAIVPPKTFNPLTATADELAQFLFAPKPPTDEPGELKTWTTDAEAYKGVSLPSFCLGPISNSVVQSTASVSPPQPLAHFTSGGVAGYQNTGGGYQKVAGHFTQPDNYGGSGVYIWGGLNGRPAGTSTGITVLAQAGTAVDNAGDAHGFWETFCNPQTGKCNGPQGSTSVAPGTDIAFSVYYNPATQVTVYQVANQGVLVVDGINKLPAGYTTGGEADFYVEKVGGQTLMQFNQINWVAARTSPAWNGTTYSYLAQKPLNSIEMTNNGVFYSSSSCHVPSGLLAYPEGAGAANGVFDVVWCHYS